MIAEILADRKIGNDRYAEVVQQPGRPDAGDLQQPRGVGGAGGDYDLLAGEHSMTGRAIAVVDIFDADGFGALEQDACRSGIGPNVQASRCSGRVQEDPSGGMTEAAIDEALEVADAGLAIAGIVVLAAGNAEFAGALDEGLANRVHPIVVGHWHAAGASVDAVVADTDSALATFEVG